MKEVHLTIDGKPVTVAENSTILEAARKIGIFIPTLCYQDNIGNGLRHNPACCRVCMVEVTGRRNLAPACATPVTEGMSVLTNTERVTTRRKAVMELLLSAHAGDCEAPCTMACPAHADVEEYVRSAAAGYFEGALKIIKEKIPMPLSVGRVCPRFCEKQCRRNIGGEPVAINEFKRAAADKCYDTYMEDIPADTGKRVAVIGAGPAGLSAAYYLRLKGIAVTIYDMMPAAGGMTRYGIPEYRLPKAVLNRELAHFEQMGIKFKFGQKLGGQLSLDNLKTEFDAVVLAIGCWRAASLRCEGDELAASGIDYLRNAALNNYLVANPGRVLVVGGGNTAMDCLRTSVRLGSPSVSCLYRRTEKEMPAEKLEIAEAREEGVEFKFLTAPVKLERRNGELVLTCRKMELGVPDASGRRAPVPVPGSEFELTADTVISAIGQSTILPEGVPGNKRGNIATVSAYSTAVTDKIYSAGDCVSGAATVVEALAAGRLAANEIGRDLLNQPMPPEQICVTRGDWRDLEFCDLVFQKGGISLAPRQQLPTLAPEERKHNFREITSTMTREQLAEEGARCISCSCAKKEECELRSLASTLHCDPLRYLKEIQKI